jgi:type IV pilus assembly protein PilW
MVSSCQDQAFMEVTSYSVASGIATITHTNVRGATTTSPGNASNSISSSFPIDAEVIPVVTTIYFVAPSSAGTGNALWRKYGKEAAEELVEGIDGMRLMFGVDTTDDQEADSYVKASAVGATNWGNVVSVRVALLVRSLDQYGNTLNNRSYSLLGTNTTSFGDARQRQVFGATVALRNQTL